MNTRRLVRVQAASGLAFLLFTALHLLNTALAALGPGAYDGFQRAVRPVYQHPLVEVSLIMVPLLVHIGSGVLRMRGRPRTARPRARQRVHRYTGYFLLVFIFGHIGATRLPSLLGGVWPEFGGVAYTFQAVPAWFYPYYTALALAGLLHGGLGLGLALRMLGARVPRWNAWIPLGLLAALVLLGLAGLGGLLYPVADQADHPYARMLQGFWGGGT